MGRCLIALIALIALIGMVDAHRIAKTYETSFAGPWFTTWKGLAVVVVALIALIIGLRVFVFEPFQTPSAAMLPTLQENDQFFVGKVALVWWNTDDPKRAGIVPE